MGWTAPPVEASLSDKFREEGNARALKELHAKRDINGLLDFALLLNTMYVAEIAKSKWAIGEAMRAPAYPITEDHMTWAADLMHQLQP